MENVRENSNNIDTNNLNEISKPFLLLTLITLIINLYLFLRCKEDSIKLLLFGGLLIEISTIYSIIKENQEILTILDQCFLIITLIGCVFFDKIYLCFIVYLILTAFITREIYNVCFFTSYAPKELNGTLTIFIMIIMILMRIFFQKLYPNLLKF